MTAAMTVALLPAVYSIRAENTEIWLDSTNAADRLVVRDSEGRSLTETTADGHTGFGAPAGSNTVTVSGGILADQASVTGDASVQGSLSVDGTLTASALQGDGHAVTNVSVAWEQITDKPTDVVIENRTSDPENPQTGRIWLRTDL